MTYRFSKKSLEKIEYLHDDLKLILFELIKVMDVTVIYTWRSKKDQEYLYKIGNSKLKWPYSKHNTPNDKPSQVMAVDIAPYPYSGSQELKNLARYYYMQGVVMGIAFQNGIKIRSGSDWDGDNDFKDQSFDDLMHVELIKPELVS